jgi:hypothetical protein
MGVPQSEPTHQLKIAEDGKRPKGEKLNSFDSIAAGHRSRMQNIKYTSAASIANVFIVPY